MPRAQFGLAGVVRERPFFRDTEQDCLAGLFAVAVDRFGHAPGGLDRAADRTVDLASRQVAAEHGDELALAQPVGQQYALEQRAVETAEAAAEIRVFLDGTAHLAVSDRKAEPAGFELHQPTAHQCLHDFFRQSEPCRHFRRDIAAQTPAQLVELPGVIAPEFFGADLGLADLRHGVFHFRRQIVTDAPGGEAQDQEGEEDFGEPGGGAFSERGQHVGAGPVERSRAS